MEYHSFLLREASAFEAVLSMLLILASIVGFLAILRGFFLTLFNFNTSTVIGGSKFKHVELFQKKLTANQIQVLDKHFSFYQKLPVKSKRIFESRVKKFCNLKTFRAKQGLTVSDEIKIFIGASAVQLTFGLSDYRFLHFKIIEIYPEKFFSKRGKAYHLGETDPRGGVLRFSWADFVKGYAIGDDNRNLGLHEFSHALFLNYLAGKKDDWHFNEYYEVWKSEGSRQFFRLKKNESTYIRKYAQTNLMEFFAVCVECFFETPDKLHEFHPKIFNSIKKLLGQDPRILNAQE